MENVECTFLYLLSFIHHYIEFIHDFVFTHHSLQSLHKYLLSICYVSGTRYWGHNSNNIAKLSAFLKFM